ncbi:hypothetical protein LINGRAHAP2_LOCUS9624 [Linum grandiflorum]
MVSERNCLIVFTPLCFSGLYFQHAFAPVRSRFSPTDLRLRLEHVWKVGNPAQPDRFFALGTIWMDAEGVRIQGDTHKNFAALLQTRISIGSVYDISNYSFRSPQPIFRTCRYPRLLDLTPSTKFTLHPSGDPFNSENFALIPFSKFPGRLPPVPI